MSRRLEAERDVLVARVRDLEFEASVVRDELVELRRRARSEIASDAVVAQLLRAEAERDVLRARMELLQRSILHAAQGGAK